MKKLSLASLVLLSVSSVGFAAPGDDVAGLSTDINLVTVGKSVFTGPTHGAPNHPGIGVYSVGGSANVNAQVLYENLRTGPLDANGIATIGGNAHANMGVWALGRVSGSDNNDVYFGAWQGPTPGGPTGSLSYAAYVVGDNVTRSLDAVKGSSYDYTTKGVGQGNEFYTGTLTANFNNTGTGGTVTGALSSVPNGGTHTITLDSGTNIVVGATAGFTGSANAGAYDVDGLFYGANAQALGGVASHTTDSSKSVGFAGTRP